MKTREELVAEEIAKAAREKRLPECTHDPEDFGGCGWCQNAFINAAYRREALALQLSVPPGSGETMDAFGRKWRRVWQEDDAARGTEGATTVHDAWARIFGGKMPPNREATATQDEGDAILYLHRDVLYQFCHDGRSIWVPTEGET